jgi:hypothetical protein
MFKYRNILKQAWKNTWQHKYLWFFGLFAALLGNTGELEVIWRSLSNNFDQGIFAGLQSFASTGIFSFGIIANIGRLFVTDPFSIFMVLIVLLFLLIISIFLIWLSVTSQAVLVNNTANILNDKKHSFSDGVAAGVKKFWPVLGLNLVLRAAIYIILVLISLPIISSLASGSLNQGGLLFLISFIIFIPLAIILSFIVKYSIAYVVLKGRGFTEALSAGWRLFLDNWLVSIEMALILFAINFLVGFILLWLALILAVPFLFIAAILSKIAIFVNFWSIFLFILVPVFILIILAGAILSTFQIVAWTNLFIELIGQGAVSKIVRVFGK